MRNLHSRAIVVATFIIAFAIAPSAASAQDVGAIPLPAVELSAGYTFMRDTSAGLPEDVNFPLGWYAATAVNLNQWLGLVGEATGSYKNDFDVSLGGFTFTNKASVYTFMGGPRFSHKVGRLMPYGQVLAGGAHLRLTTQFPAGIPDMQRINATDTQFAFQPGGGLTVFITDRLGVRVAGDYRCIIDFVDGDENDYTNEFRFLTGFTINWGAR